MFDLIKNRKTLVRRKSLYSGWIQAYGGENAPLVRVWIDPSMTMFESVVKVHGPDVVKARAMIQAAPNKGSTS